VFVAQNNNSDVKGEVRLKLAALLPGMARWSHLALNGLLNELVNVRHFYSSVLAPQYRSLLLQGLTSLKNLKHYQPSSLHHLK
jgi:hypothetical protein